MDNKEIKSMYKNEMTKERAKERTEKKERKNG